MKRHTDITVQEVEKLLQRFMDGTSTLEEEVLLSDFFRTHEMMDEWASYKEMFALFDKGKVEVEEKKKSTAWWKYAGIAAVLALLLGVGFYFSGRNEGENNLIAQTDTIKSNPHTEQKQVEEQPLKPVEERVDSVNKAKEMQGINRPPKMYMAKITKETATVPTDSIIFSAPPYKVAAIEPEKASEPEIREIDPAYEEMKRTIRSRGEEMISQVELAINIDLDDY